MTPSLHEPSRARTPLAALQRLLREEAVLLVTLVGMTVLAIAFIMFADEVVGGEFAAFDNRIIMALRAPGNLADSRGPPWLREMGRDITALGSPIFITFVLLTVVGYLLLIRKRAAALLMAVAVLGGGTLSTLLKMTFDRARPDIPRTINDLNASFPSGHTTLSAVAFLTIGILLVRVTPQRRLRTYFMTIAVLLSLMIGLSRIYLGVHYPTDVFAGWCVGGAWALLCSVVAWRLQRRGAIEAPGPE
jgi:undecaprenyl-diphosphatase